MKYICIALGLVALVSLVQSFTLHELPHPHKRHHTVKVHRVELSHHHHHLNVSHIEAKMANMIDNMNGPATNEQPGSVNQA